MALGERDGGAKEQWIRAPTSSLHDLDDLYDNNAFDQDEQTKADAKPSKGGGSDRKQQFKGSKLGDGGAASNNDYNNGESKAPGKLDFDVWVARKDKYERVAQTLSKLNTERAANDEQWIDVAVALAATDLVLKTGKTDRCDCPGICHEPAHSVTKQRTRCQCPAKKCTLCNRCMRTTPGQITEKMIATLSPYRVESRQTILTVAEQVVAKGEGQTLQPGGPKISTAVLRMATAVLSQCSILANEDGTRIQRPCSCPLRSLGDLWVKWTTKFHTFSHVALSETEANKFASGTRQMMEFDEEAKVYYMTLKWHQAAKPQKGDTAKIAARRALTADQKKQNALFLTLCKKFWVQAQHKVVETLQTKMDEMTQLPPEKRKKSTAEMEVSVLNSLGVKRMVKWLEEDQEAIEEKQKEEEREKAEGGVIAHNAWVKRKDRLRIRLPTPESAEKKPGGGWKPPRFDFSVGVGVVRQKKVKVPSSAVELMKHSGLKYVHAMNEGFQGRGGDLEKSKQMLVKKGHILKANFDSKNDDNGGDDNPFSKDRYLFEKQHNAALKKKKESGKQRQAHSKESYAAWSAHKALKDKAAKYLAHIPMPKDTSDAAATDDDSSVPAAVRWEEVGKALKAVDRGLLEDWVKWSDGFRSATRCRMLWESFAPVACDVHCTSSAIRDVFLKLLHRKGVNYKQAFLSHCDRKHKKLLLQGTDDSLPEEMTDDEKMERFAALSSKEFAKLLQDLGIVLQAEEVQRLLEYFDTNGDQLVSMKEFLDVVGEKRRMQCHGDTDKLLQQVCMWETVCHECGMLNAFQLVLGSSASGARTRAELPGHVKRREQSARFDCHPETDMRVVRTNAPKTCAYSKWTDEQAAPFIKKLELWSAEQREQHVLQQLVTEGAPPEAPPLFRDDDDALDPTTTLLLRWAPPPVNGNNGPAFYILETMGAEGTASFRNVEFRELYRDPKDYLDNDGAPRYRYVVTGLSPNTKYGFRLRALNGFGAGPYTFGYFVTAPSIPPAPLAIKVTANSIHLGWASSSYYRKQLRELRQVFDEADTDGNGQISRDEFMEEIERRKPRLLEFLQKTNANTATGGVPLSIFDAIETDDNESISWQEFMTFFHGYVDEKCELESTKQASTSAGNGGVAASLRSSSSSARSVRESTALGATSKSSRKAQACRYILKQCTNEAQGEYVEIYRGTKAAFVVHGLASGSTYQFRVQAYNDDGLYSLHSEAVVVNTLLPTPAAPVIVDVPSCSHVRLKWAATTAKPSLAHDALQAKAKSTTVPAAATSAATTATQPRRKGAAPCQDDQIARILKEWAQESAVDDGSVDFRAKFDRYDVDHSNYIELPEFKTLLEELGVTASEERMAAYLEEFDGDQDGKISFEEFKRWWTKTDVQYVLKRNSGHQDSAPDPTTSRDIEAGNQLSIVSFRGKETVTAVHGLAPNTSYQFRLRAVSSHATSQLSEALEVVTAPAAPTCAGIVSVLANSVTLVWYPGLNGASKYAVDIKFIETMPLANPAAVGVVSKKARTSPDWTRVYDGSDTLTTVTELAPNSVYRVRVVALNRTGVASGQSTVSQLCTRTKDEERLALLRPANAPDHFTIECHEQGDVVVGDTVLFSERLVRNDMGKVVGEEQAGKASGGGALLAANASMYSVSSFQGAIGAVGGVQFVGERTIAARVVASKVHDKYGPVLTMEVVWCTVQLQDDVLSKVTAPTGPAGRGRQAANASIHTTSHALALAQSAYALPTDSKISRKERSIYRFETFRTEWQDERARHPSSWDQ
ncbi:TPA: hypothetical protein N0F65_007083 [Lagenidium giganteum]|uniref:Calmodulin n=1 Tax=Lagenidium giganteum TaxID=4803 RepID=A0AAV2YUA6_9STRA|nr:TPA: hypothetical protein N0F65_007083 [Lagenidium giganteum]